MSAAAAAAPLQAPSVSPEPAIALLRDALDEELLDKLGWDPKGLVLRRVFDHPSFGLPACEVEGCEGMISRCGSVCLTCWYRFERWRANRSLQRS